MTTTRRGFLGGLAAAAAGVVALKPATALEIYEGPLSLIPVDLAKWAESRGLNIRWVLNEVPAHIEAALLSGYSTVNGRDGKPITRPANYRGDMLVLMSMPKGQYDSRQGQKRVRNDAMADTMAGRRCWEDA